MFKEVKSVIESKIIHGDTVEPDKLSIKYLEMGSFIITLRNRFFHYLNGGAKNIDSSEIVDSDKLFSIVNPVSMYWLAMIFLGILTHGLNEHQNHLRSAGIN